VGRGERRGKEEGRESCGDSMSWFFPVLQGQERKEGKEPSVPSFILLGPTMKGEKERNV